MLIQPISLAVVDDHSLYRKLLVEFLSKQKNIVLKIEADNATDLLKKLKKTPVEVILLDLFMPKLNSIDAISIIRNEFPDIKIIIVTICTDLTIVRGFLDLGIYAYLSKDEYPQDLYEAIMFASEGRIYRNRLFTEALYLDKEQSLRKGIKKPVVNLDEREKKIIQLLWNEKSNKEIAADIYLSMSSVEKIKQELKEKLGVKSIAGLFNYALQHGIISVQKIVL